MSMPPKNCSKCGASTLYREGVSKSSGKSYRGYFCQNKQQCNNVDFLPRDNGSYNPNSTYRYSSQNTSLNPNVYVGKGEIPLQASAGLYNAPGQEKVPQAVANDVELKLGRIEGKIDEILEYIHGKSNSTSNS